MRRLLTSFAALSLIFSNISAQDLGLTEINILEISDDQDAYNLNEFASVFSEADTIGVEEAYERIMKGEMSQVSYEGNPGMTNSDVAYWLLFTISNNSQQTDFRLELAYPQLDYIQFAEIDSSNIKLISETGDSFVFDQRPLAHRNFIFPISIPKGKTMSFLLNADKRKSAIRFPLELMTLERFTEKNDKERIYLSIYYVFIVIIVCGAVTIGLGLKRNVFLWFALSVACYGLWLFTWQGFSYQFLIPNQPLLNRHFLPFCSQIAILSLLAFIQSFFETKRLLPKFNAVMNGILGFFILGTIVWIIIPNTYVEFAPKLFAVRYILVGTILTFGITAALRYAKVNKERSIIFAISYSVFFIGIIGKIMEEYGLIDEFSFVYDPILIGNLIQVLGLSTAMIFILVGVVNDREVLQQKTEELQQSIHQLEQKSRATEEEFFTLKSKALIPVNRIKYIQSDGPYVEIFVEGKDNPEIDRMSLSKMKEKLPGYFKQIHRSVIVNFRQVKIKRVNSVTLKDQTTLNISRSFKEELREYSA